MFRPFLIRPSSDWIQLSEEVSRPLLLTLSLMIIHYIALYGSSDNCIQPDDGLITNGRNM